MATVNPQPCSSERNERVELPIARDAPVYTCPGEKHPISRSVHYARLAAFFPQCRTCAHRHDTGQLPRQTVRRIDRTAQRPVRSSLVTTEGVRGIYLNEMSRVQSEKYAAAFASLLWDQQPPCVPVDGGGVPKRRGPVVVIGQDGRPAAAELLVATAGALRRMGCQLIDIGTVSTPCFWFAVEHLQATGGLYVTGQGFGPAVIGLDFIEAGGIPWSSRGRLDELEPLVKGSIPRATRKGGSQRSFRAGVPYQAGLLRHFHALRPLHIGMLCNTATIRPLVKEIFASLPCRVSWVEPPVADDAQRALALAVARLSDHVRDERLHAGFCILDDAQSCVIVDERGGVLPVEDVTRGLVSVVLQEVPAPAVVLDDRLAPELGADLSGLGCRVTCTTGNREMMSRTLQSGGAPLGADAAGRYWFADASPRCDAVITLAKVLQVLSRSDAPASALRCSK